MPHATNLPNAFLRDPEECPRIETPHRRIVTKLPVPASLERVRAASRVFPDVNCYQAPILWDRAVGYQVFDDAGNCWIDFSSTAVTTNAGHGHPAIREAIEHHAREGLLAQFSFLSDIRVRLAEKLLELAPPGCEKVYFWTVGSEAVECSLRLAREWGMRQHSEKFHILTHGGDYHGWTLAAHQLSGPSARKTWLPHPDPGIHHIPFPLQLGQDTGADVDWAAWLEKNLAELIDPVIARDHVAAVFVETMQGWGALPLPPSYVQALRRFCDEHDALLIFDEVQTGFGRTGKWFGHEHYDARADLLCIGKGLTSSLPLAAVLGPADVLDVLPPGEVTTTHAAHPLSCAAALANLSALEEENLIEAGATTGELVADELCRLQQRFPNHIADVCGLGLLRAIHVRDPQTGQPSRELARDWTWAAVKHGVMLFQTNQPTIKVCPPLTIPEDAVREGVAALGTALESLL